MINLILILHKKMQIHFINGHVFQYSTFSLDYYFQQFNAFHSAFFNQTLDSKCTFIHLIDLKMSIFSI